MSDTTLEQLRQDVRYLIDRSAILDCIASHARGHDRHDIELLTRAYHDDGIDEHGFAVNSGPEYARWANKVHAKGSLLHTHNITTHTCEIDWLLPGIAPTGKRVEIPLVAIVRFEGDKVAHEHIYWDQAAVLVQVGLLDPKGLPVAGVETARKVVDNGQPSNTLMRRWPGSANKPI